MAPIALITRPDEDAEPLAAALIARGIEVLREPLLTIRPVANAHLDLAGVQALLFTSANGVRAFASLSSRRDLPALAVGDATAKTLKDAGFLKVESAGGAVEDLAALATRKLDPHGGPLFHAAGSAVAGDLAGLLGKDGFELRRVVLYEAETAHALSAETREKLAAGEIGLVLLFSPRTAETFLRLVRDAGPEVTAGVGKAIALCLSPAVARAIEPLSWRGVKTAERPELPAMLALVDVAAAELRPQGNGPGPILDLEPETVPNPAEIEAALKRMTPKRRSGGFVVALLVLLALGAVAYFTRASWQPPLMAMLDRG
ncbi:MAG: uroporphyrinogen-III synthase, partial [Dongiaceae bacterium]